VTRSRPRIDIVCIGTELLTGKVNTHTAALGEILASIGLSLSREQTVGDDRALMERVFRETLRDADVIFSCGGLGPTFDDITREAWSSVLKRPLKLNAELVRDIEKKFKARGLQMPPMNKRQAQVLQGAEVIPNLNGTAPGQYLSVGKKILILLPGPTRELFPMIENFVVPRLRSIYTSSFLVNKSFLSVGIPESQIDQAVRPLVKKYQTLENCRITHGILASQSIVTVKLTVEGKKERDVQQVVERLSKEFRKCIGGSLFGEDRDTLPAVIGELLRAKNKKLAVAESCTGGLIAKLLTDEPGSSDYFVEGVITYANASKQKRLGVASSTLLKNGAVSEEVAREMAKGLKKSTRVDYTLSVTGIAGPAGGSPAKPVGLVYIGCSGPRGTSVKKFQFSGDREWIRHRAALMALDFLRKELIA
jgi:nicotinamide-nucleotide amidase